MYFTAFYLLALSCQVKACTYILKAEALNCNGQDLLTIPLDYPRGAKVLLMSDNLISRISKDVCTYYNQARTLVIRGNPFNCSEVCPRMVMICDMPSTSSSAHSSSTSWSTVSHTSSMGPVTSTSTLQTSTKDNTVQPRTTTTTAPPPTSTTPNEEELVITLSISIPSGLSIVIGITIFILRKIKQRMAAQSTELNDTQEIDLTVMQDSDITAGTSSEETVASGPAAPRYWMRSHSK